MKDRICGHCGSAVSKPDPAYLRSVREKAGVGLRVLAERIGVSAPYLSDVERGNRNCSEKVLKWYVKLENL